MKSKIIQFQLTHNGIVALCEDGSMWSASMREYMNVNTNDVKWNLIFDCYYKES